MWRAAALSGVIFAATIAVSIGDGPYRPNDNARPSLGLADELAADVIGDEDELDPYIASESIRKSRIVRNSHQLGEETFGASREAPGLEEPSHLPETSEDAHHLSESNARPFRRRSGGRWRRPLDPERRRQLLLRRQKLGLPIRKFQKAKKNDDDEEARSDTGVSPDMMDKVSVLVATPGPKMVRVFPDVFTTTESPKTTTSATSTTSLFPSFSAASRLRQRFKTIRDEWGLKTTDTQDKKEIDKQPSENDPRGRVTSRARVVTASTRGTNRNDKRLRYRPVLVRKKLRSKVKVTSPAPSYPVADPPALEPVPVDYEEPEASYDIDTQSYDSISEEPFVQDTFQTEPYYFSTEPTIYETVTKPRHTPVPKKVAVERPTQRPKKRFQETSTRISDIKTKNSFRSTERSQPKSLTPVPLGPELTPTIAPDYFSEVQHFTEPTHVPEFTFTSEPTFISDPAFASELSYHPSHVPAFAPEPDFDYGPQPAYAQEQLYAEEPVYDFNYDTSEEYSFEDYEDKPSIFDQYKYGYSVASKDTGNYHARSEARDGETVSGSYKVALPDGRVQIVTYVADDNGFRAEVNYEGEAVDQSSDSPLPPPSVSLSDTHQRPSLEDRSPLFRQHVVPKVHFEKDQQDFHHDSSQPQAHQSRVPSTPQPHPQHVRLTPRPVIRPKSRPFEKPDLEDDLTPTQASRPINQNLRFHDSVHVTTPSPNPFRLVVEKSRASTFAPPVHSATINAFRNAMILHRVAEFTTPSSPTTRPPDAGTFTPSYKATEQHTSPPTTTYSPIIATFKPLSNSREQDNSLQSTTPPPSIKLRPAFSPNNLYGTSDTTPSTTVTEPPRSETTNAHTMRPPHSPTDTPNTSGVYQYHSHDDHPTEERTTLYNPDPNSAAYIHALGRTHAVPILLPVDRLEGHGPLHHRPLPIVTTSTPRTYYLNTPAVVFPKQRSTPNPPQLVRMIRVTPSPPLQFSSAEGVEVIRGDSLRRRLTLKVPEPHETDIYPTPRPRIMIL